MHVKLYLVKNAFRRIQAQCQDAECSRVMMCLAKLYAYDTILSAAAEFTKGNFISGNEMDVIRESFYEMLAELRPNVVQLADSWDLPDRALGSVLGRRDGNVYPALMEWAKKSPLNKSQVFPAFDKYLGPMMKIGRSHL